MSDMKDMLLRPAYSKCVALCERPVVAAVQRDLFAGPCYSARKYLR